MKKLAMLTMAVVLVTSAAASATYTWRVPEAELGYGGHIKLAATPQQVMYGGEMVWEYVYDIGASAWAGNRCPDVGFGLLLEMNGGQVDDLVGLRNGQVAETWSSFAAGNIGRYGWWGPEWSDPHVQWVDGADLDADGITDEWTYALDADFGNANYMTFDADLATWAYNNGTNNIWHAPSDYNPLGAVDNNGELGVGTLHNDVDSAPLPWGAVAFGETKDALTFGYGNFWVNVEEMDTNLAQLAGTIRLLSRGAPTGTITMHYDSGYGPNKIAETVVGPGAVPEPATMSLLAIGGIAALIRRKK